MKKKFYPVLFAIAILLLFGCAKNKPEIHTTSQLIGLWSEYSFHFKAYKGSQVIEEYTEAVEPDEQNTMQFFEDGTFEVFERDLENGIWEVSNHVKGLYTYNLSTNTISLESNDGTEQSDAKVLTLTDKKLDFLQTETTTFNNPESDKEEFTSFFNKIQ